jgi:hypothetical protein
MDPCPQLRGLGRWQRRERPDHVHILLCFLARVKNRSARSYAATARRDYASGNVEAAEYMINLAVRTVGEAQHPLADETSPTHRGFQVWFEPLDGLLAMGPLGYYIFVEHHHNGESAQVYADAGLGPANEVAGQIHSVLTDILRE